MNKIMILVDSTADLSKEMIAGKNVTVVPLTVNFSDESFHDGVDITTKELYTKVAAKGELPKTAAITIGEIYAYFEKYLDEGYDIIYTGISSTMSKSYENAVMTAQEFPEGRIEVVDSQNLSSGIGLVVLKACEWIEEGKDVHEVANLMRETIPYVRSQFMVETMEYLHKGGRCSSVAKLFGTILKIRPIIAVREGKMGVAAKPRGKTEAALDCLLDMFREDSQNIETDRIFITHSMAEESYAYLKEKVSEIRPDVPQLEAKAGCIISTHCGPGTIGILYILKH
jgi:DegV family protein with EDD domain